MAIKFTSHIDPPYFCLNSERIFKIPLTTINKTTNETGKNVIGISNCSTVDLVYDSISRTFPIRTRPELGMGRTNRPLSPLLVMDLNLSDVETAGSRSNSDRVSKNENLKRRSGAVRKSPRDSRWPLETGPLYLETTLFPPLRMSILLSCFSFFFICIWERKRQFSFTGT